MTREAMELGVSAGVRPLLTFDDVLRVTGWSDKRSVRTAVMERRFPAPIQVGPNTVRWRAEDIEKWAAECPPVSWAPKVAEG